MKHSIFILGLIGALLHAPSAQATTNTPVDASLSGPSIENRMLSLYNSYNPIHRDLARWIQGQDQRANNNAQVGAKLKDLWQSYQPSSSHYSASIADHCRIWLYDAALGIYAMLVEHNHERARRAVDNTMTLLRAEKRRGYRGLFHFSYNALSDHFIDPREPQGATQWMLKALYAYMLETDDVRHFNELTSCIREDVFPLQILAPEHPAYGLLRHGYAHPKGLLQGGYGIYTNIPALNQVNHSVNLEHNADFIDMLRLMTHVIDRHPEIRSVVGDNFRDELQRRHALCMQAVIRIRKDTHWPTGFDEFGQPNESRAVDHYTWLAHTFIGVDHNRQIPWESIQVFQKEFTIAISSMAILNGTREIRVPLKQPATGLFFFQQNYADPNVIIPFEDRHKLEKMIQPEATAGGVCMLIDFIRSTEDTDRKNAAFQLMATYLEGLARIHATFKTIEGYEGGGMPYATEFIRDYFGPHPSMAAVASYLIALSKLERDCPYFLGVPPPPGFERALQEHIDIASLPEAIPLPLVGAIPDQAGLTHDNLKDIQITNLYVTAGQLHATLHYPAQGASELEILVLKLTDIWYIQPRISGVRAAGQALPPAGVNTIIPSFRNDLDRNSLLIVARKGHHLRSDSTIHPSDLERYFRDGIFIVGMSAKGEVYHARSF